MAVISTTYFALGSGVTIGPGTVTVPALIIKDSAGNLDNGFYSDAVDSIGIAIGGAGRYTIDANKIQSNASGSWALPNEVSSGINPTLVPSNDDFDTGIGHAGADNLNFVVGGVLGISLVESGGVITAIRLSGPVTEQTAINIASFEGQTLYFEGNAVFN